MAEHAQSQHKLDLFSSGVFKDTPVVKIDPRERIYKIGEPATHTVFIRKGIAFVGFSSRDGERNYLAEMVKGPALIGEDAILQDSAQPAFRKSFAKAITSCEVQFLSSEDMRNLASTSPEVYMEFIQQTAQRLKGITSKFARSRNGSLAQVGAAVMDFWDAKQGVNEGVRFTQQDIADYEGLTRPTIVKILQDIAGRGIGTLKTTIDPTALTAYIAETRRVVSNPGKDVREVPDLSAFDLDKFDLEALIALTQTPEISDPKDTERKTTPKRERRNVELLKNIGMVFKVARQFGERGILDQDDHFQEGVLGLMRVIDRGEIDEEKGGLASLGWKYVRGYILNALRNRSRTIRVPIHVYDHHRKVTDAWEKRAQDVQSQPSVADVAVDVEVSPENIEHTLAALDRRTISLTIENDDDTNQEIDAVDRNPLTEDVVIANELSERIEGLLKSNLFSKTEVLIIKAKHLRDRPVSSDRLAEALGVTRTAVDAIESRALTKFRSADLREELLDYYR